MLFPPLLFVQHHVRVPGGPGGGPAEQTASFGVGLVLPEVAVPVRRGGVGAELREEGHFRRKVGQF